MSHYFERPKFKSIIHYYLNQYCDMESQLEHLEDEPSDIIQQFPAALKKSMRLFIIEIIPTILVSDGHNFIEAIFTKESINDFRKNYSHVKFSNLRDKVIYVTKWQLQLDHADSKKQFNSFQNINIKLVIEQFKPLMHESLNTRLTHSATSIFRNPDIQTLVKNYRHWFAQTLISKNAYNSQTMIALPSLNEVVGSTKGKKHGQSEYSQNTTQFSENDNNIGEDFGGNIQKTQIFRIDVKEFTPDLKIDSHLDFEEFKNQVVKQKTVLSTELRFADIDRIVIQEKGEQFYAEKKFSKSRQWLEQVQDEYRREELTLQIEYFQVGSKTNKFDSHFETMWQREEREKQQKKFVGGGYRSRRIIGYTLGYTASSIKEKLIKMLDSTKTNQLTFQDYANKHISKAKSVSPTKGRPRSNSQENLLQLTNMDDSKSQLFDQGIDGREPLSQFVQHQMPIFHDDDTQSEQDSMENAIEQQLQIEREIVPDRVFDGIQPLGYSMYKSYLQWFQQNDISHESYIQKQLERDFEEEARQEEILRLKKEADSKRFSFRLVEKNKPKIEEENVEMADEEQNQIIEQRPESPIMKKQRSESPILQNQDSFMNSPIKQEQSDHQLELEESEEQEDLELKEESESGEMSPIQQYKQPKDEDLPKKHLLATKEESAKVSPKRLFAKEESDSKKPKEESQRSSPQKNLKSESQRFSPMSRNQPKDESSEQVPPKRFDPVGSVKSTPILEDSQKSSPIMQNSQKSSPIMQDSFKSSPIMQDSQREVFQTPAKPLIELNMGMTPPKPIHLMSTGEKAMWDLEIQFKQMQEEMERKQREMMEMFNQKKKAAMMIKEEEERKERERIEQERHEKERLEKERIEKERLEKERREKERQERERHERERLEKERLQKERIQKERLDRERIEKQRALMRQREKFELTLMLQEDISLQAFYQEERRQFHLEQERQLHLQQERIRLEKELQMELERQKRMQQDRERQEQIQRQEMERIESEKKQRLSEAQASQAKVTQEAVEAEKRRRMAMLKEEERLKQQKLQLQESDDWEEGQQAASSNSASFDEELVQKLDQEREFFIKNMNKKFGNTLNQEIRRMETKDMTRRKIKKVENEDKLYDFVKIKNIKQEKIEQQRRQLENSSSHSQPSKDSKESKKHQKEEPELEESSEKLSSSKSEEEGDLNQYDLFDNKNEEEMLPEIDDESVQEITQSQLESPIKVIKSIETYPKKDENNQIKELSAQIAMLQQQLGQAVQSIKILSSQSQLKDAQKPTHQNAQMEDDDEEYHLPAFGSQVSPCKKKIEPFNLGKRNYSQFEEEQQYRAYEQEYSNSPTKKEQFKNLTEFVDYKKMETHKTNIQQQHVERERKQRLMRQQQRQGSSQSQPRSSSAGSSQGNVQQMQQRQRERSASRESQNMRPPSQGQPFVKQQQQSPPQMAQQQQKQRPPQQQQQIQRPAFAQQQPPRHPQGQQALGQHPQGQHLQAQQSPRQRSGSPVKQIQQQPPMAMAGSKRYVHSQNPAAQQPGYMRQNQKMQGISQNYQDPQTIKRRKIVIEDDDQ